MDTEKNFFNEEIRDYAKIRDNLLDLMIEK